MINKKITILLLWIVCMSSPLLWGQEELIREDRDIEIDTSQNLRTKTVKYIIDARFSPGKEELKGIETVTLINKSPEPAKYIDFLTFNRPGFMEIDSLRRISAGILAGKTSYAPLEGNNPITRVYFEPALAPYASVTLEMEFTLKIPAWGQGNGKSGDYYFFSHWFPRPVNPKTQEIADFGDFKVGITLPENYVSGASGHLEKSEKKSGKRMTYLYSGNNMPYFAWTASPSFKALTKKIKILDSGEEKEILLLLSPRRAISANRYFRALEGGLQYLAKNQLVYPYSRITLVAPPPEAMIPGGQAFPALIVSGSTPLIPGSLKISESWTLRGLAGQFFPTLDNSPDPLTRDVKEGLVRFLEMETWNHVFKEDPTFAKAGFLEISHSQMHRLDFLSSPGALENIWPGGNKKAKRLTMLLLSLQNYLGRDRMMDFLVFSREKFKYTRWTGKDFLDALENFMDRDLSWALNQYVYSNRRVDNAVAEITSAPDKGQPEKFRNRAVFIRRGGYFPVKLVVGLENGKTTQSFWEEGEIKVIQSVDDSPISFAAIDPQQDVLLDINFQDNRKTRGRMNQGHSGTALKLAFLFQNLLAVLGL